MDDLRIWGGTSQNLSRVTPCSVLVVKLNENYTTDVTRITPTLDEKLVCLYFQYRPVAIPAFHLCVSPC